MQLKYLKGDSINLYLGHPVKTYRCSPIGDIPEPLAIHILKTRPNDFEMFVKEPEKPIDTVEGIVEQEKFKCDICEYESPTNAGLSAHKRYNHKEK